MIYEEITKNIRAVCERLLEDKEVELIVAYRSGGVSDALIPYFATEPADAQNIVWGDRCYANLATYLHGMDKKTGILAKPCDARAIVQYIAEQQLKRENVYIIGVDCMGMVDENGDPRPGCDDCKVRIPPVFDEHIIDDRAGKPDTDKAAAADPDIADSFERFQKEIDKCILCYACRQACYGCYCKTCFIDRDVPNWKPAEIDAGAKMTFHMGRTMHLADRCVECGACEAACQSGVNLRYIIKEVTKFVEEEYGFSAGMDPAQASALLTNEVGDREIGFLGGVAHD